ncbi:MAG TPA: S8 family serine peptidase [Streptosporangiaceae bacterium]|nr:S8 family serine peptidase [Streptosporangiaceae bacterium]
MPGRFVYQNGAVLLWQVNARVEEERGMSSDWARDRHAELCERREPQDVLEGPGYLYRPRQILVSQTPQVGSVIKGLAERGAVEDPKLTEEFARAKLPVLAFLMPPRVHIPGIVDEFRGRGVAPNHVFCGEGPPPPDYHGGPAGEPHDAMALDEDPYAEPEDVPVLVAVLDTGYDPEVPALHKGLAWRVRYTAADVEAPVGADGYLTSEGGHGTFIDGIIMRIAPSARIRQVKVLDPAGVGDDATTALALGRADAPVINLSLGGYTADDQPPVASTAAIAALPAGTAVVAAAGNNNKARPFYPAATEGVLSVGAVDIHRGRPRRAHFSNYGPWVRVWLPGTRIRSTYLQGIWKRPSDPLPRPMHGTACWNGTSFAAPQLAALIANQIKAAGTAAAAADAVLASAVGRARLGPVIIPEPGVADCEVVRESAEA